MVDRRKKVINFREAVTRKILTAAAERHGAQVLSKVRLADVLQIDHSGLEGDLYSFALKAHFDCVVADENWMPLFAVEFDGPHHELDERARNNDKKKNKICEQLEFPLARVRDEHIFQKARGIDYLTWLTELYFAFQALIDAQDAGSIPPDDPLDPMLFMSIPDIPGRFPLFISALARVRLQRLHEQGLITAPAPFHLDGDSQSGTSESIAAVTVPNGRILRSSASIYLWGFGVSPSEAAEEIAVVSLAKLALTSSQNAGITPRQFRTEIIQFLRTHRCGSWGGGSPGIPLGFLQREGRREWRVGILEDEPEVVIPA
ncbi:MAG: DUF2726 domain-containing protein [Gemmatimonadota bacterium]